MISGGRISFTRLTSEVGFNEEYSNTTGFGLGVVWIDYNNDDWPDLFAVNDVGFEPHIYRNNRDGTFTLLDELLPALPDVRMPVTGSSSISRGPSGTAPPWGRP